MTGIRDLRWIRVLAIAGFLLHAGVYLYFFVDDEAIPYVYAQNLLEGNGLVYSVEDGHVEGFSDFLHVMLAAVILGTTRTLHLPPLAVFPIGKAISLAAGCALIWVAGSILLRLGIFEAAVHAAALALLALAGPLAVWSCSSLEAIPFALGLAVLTYALIGDAVLPGAAALATVFLVLERSDGFIWAGAIAVAFWTLRSGEARRAVTWSVVLPGIVAAGAMEVFRVVYYQDVLPMPVYAKVLFKVHDNGQLIQNRPAVSYAVQFVRAYGQGPLAVGAILAAIGAARVRQLRPVLLALVVLAAYASIVGDWMFGFRFYTPLLALAAVLIAPALAGARRAVAWPAVMVVIAYSAITARTFERGYLHQPTETGRENFWMVRSLAPWHLFRPEYDLIQMLRPMVKPHDHVSYNQAGLIPYALDLENIDTLGICSRYYAELPARDVIYTEVGRYEPFTEAPVVSARGAYLLNRRPSMIIDSTVPLKRANADVVPQTILAGHYALAGIDASGLKAAYRPSGEPPDTYRRDPDSFLMNLAHPAYVKRATAGGEALAGARLLDAMEFLRGREVLVRVADKYGWQISLAERTATARYIYIGAVRAERRGLLHVALRAPDGRTILREEVPLDREYRTWSKALSPPGSVSHIQLDIDMDDARPQTIFLADLRLMGETPELRAFVGSQVRFTAR